MAEKLDNQFIPKYIPSDLKWYEHEHEHEKRQKLVLGMDNS